MSAKMETFFELKRVTDHDCGNYRIGEIDFVNLAKIREHVDQYGEAAYQDILDVCVRITSEARDQIISYRGKHHSAGCEVPS